MALTWDFSRELTAGALGNSLYFFDEMYQALYLSSGVLTTQIGLIDDGDWSALSRQSALSLDESGVSSLDVEHESNGYLILAGRQDGKVVVWIYDYMADVTDWLSSGTWKLQPDNPIKAGNVTLLNADMDAYRRSAYTLFSPGARLRLQYISGDSDPFDIGAFYIDTSPYEVGAESFTFAGRNQIGFLLADQTFDENNVFSSITRTDLVRTILTNAGVPDDRMVVMSDTTVVDSKTFEDDSTVQSGLEDLCDMWGWYYDDMPDGRIVVGDEAYVRGIIGATGIYEYTLDEDLYSLSLTRTASDAYSRVCVKRQGDNWRRIYGDVPYYAGWFVGAHRTYYQEVPEETTNAEMDRVLTDLIEGMQYTGITETFVGPLRPHLQPGDVAIVTEYGEDRIVGIITDITHSFGSNGYTTSFTVTSGGTISDPESPTTVATKYKGQLGGANRKRRLLDIIKAR